VPEYPADIQIWRRDRLAPGRRNWGSEETRVRTNSAISRTLSGVPWGSREFGRSKRAIVMFDGSGVEALAAIADPRHKMNGLVVALGDTITGACEFCAKSHNVFEPIRDAGFSLLSNNGGEASVRKLVVDGYQIMNY
jgi:hypothetical protein